MDSLLVCAGALTFALVVSVAVQVYRGSKSIEARLAFTGVLLAGVVGAVSVVAWERSPKVASAAEFVLDADGVERAASTYRLLHIVALAAGAVLAAAFVVTLVPAIRRSRAFPILRAAWAALAVLVLGYVCSSVMRRQDEAVTRSRADRIIWALDRYKDDHQGRYPPALLQLTPTYLLEVPRPRIGWRDQPFGYQVWGNRYELSYLSPRDLMTYGKPARHVGWVPRYGLWED